MRPEGSPETEIMFYKGFFLGCVWRLRGSPKIFIAFQAFAYAVFSWFPRNNTIVISLGPGARRGARTQRLYYIMAFVFDFVWRRVQTRHKSCRPFDECAKRSYNRRKCTRVSLVFGPLSSPGTVSSVFSHTETPGRVHLEKLIQMLILNNVFLQ